jgi:hypothetical protein
VRTVKISPSTARARVPVPCANAPVVHTVRGRQHAAVPLTGVTAAPGVHPSSSDGALGAAGGKGEPEDGRDQVLVDFVRWRGVGLGGGLWGVGVCVRRARHVFEACI